MRILLSAYACSPARGSEPGLGWQWARMLATRHEVHVLTTPFLQDEIEAELRTGAHPNLHIHYVPCLLSRDTAWKQRALLWLNAYEWQWRAVRAAKILHAAAPFDLAHHVTYATWRIPSFLWQLNIPFVWGPVGGGQQIPPGFSSILSGRGAFYEQLRNAAQTIGRIDPWVRQTVRRATVVLAANTPTQTLLESLRGAPLEQMLETGFFPDTTSPVIASAQKTTDEPCRLLWVGYMEPRKALGLLLEALAHVPNPNAFRLTVVGNGPEFSRYQHLTALWGLCQHVDFVGSVPYAEVKQYYRTADVFVFTSLRETSGNVLLEAMDAGLPIVSLDWSGPHDILTSETALLVKPVTPGQVTRELAAALVRLADNPELRRSSGSAGRARLLEQFSWDARANRIERYYAKALAARP